VTNAWTRTLDECEARLEAAANLAEPRESTPGRPHSQPAIAPFLPAAPTEPLPAALVARARALVDRTEALEQRLTNEQERIRSELRRLPRMPRVHTESHFEIKA
jgi:hypothetical protein